MLMLFFVNGGEHFLSKKHYMIGYIYLIIDLTNWKKYVGQHHYHIENLDPNYHGSGTIISKIYKKRPETLKEVYLKTCYTQEELDEWEKYFIFLYDTLWPNGYNLQEGGNGGVPCEETRKKISETLKGKQFSEETRRKLSDANKGKKHTEEARKKISDAKKGKPAPNKGIPMSEEARKKISDAKKGKPSHNKGIPMSEEQKKKLSKKVLQFTLNGEFIREWPSFAECERNGFYGTAVCKCCQGKQKTHKGFVWKYKD